MEQKKLKVQVNEKFIQLDGDYKGNLFCVTETSIDENPLLTCEEKESLKMDLRSNKNIKLG